MKTKIVEYEDEGYKARVIVRSRSLMGSLMHDEMQNRALGQDIADDPRQAALRTAAVVIWPVVANATHSAEISLDGQALAWPMTLEEYGELPPGLVNAWMAAAWELNPDWAPASGSSPEDEARAEKKD